MVCRNRRWHKKTRELAQHEHEQRPPGGVAQQSTSSARRVATLLRGCARVGRTWSCSSTKVSESCAERALVAESTSARFIRGSRRGEWATRAHVSSYVLAVHRACLERRRGEYRGGTGVEDLHLYKGRAQARRHNARDEQVGVGSTLRSGRARTLWRVLATNRARDAHRASVFCEDRAHKALLCECRAHAVWRVLATNSHTVRVSTKPFEMSSQSSRATHR
jgi:hypothetical protein